MANHRRRQHRKGPKARLIVDPVIKERIFALLQENASKEGALDQLLGRMIEIYEERMACPRGAVR